MKKIILTLTSLLVATTTLANPSVIGIKDGVSVTVMNAEQSLNCYTSNATKNDVVRLDAPGVTFLASGTLRQEFEGANGAICSLINKIVELSFMNFTAFEVTIDSELSLDRESIVEQASLKIANLGVIESSEQFPIVKMQVQLSQKLKQTEPDFLGH